MIVDAAREVRILRFRATVAGPCALIENIARLFPDRSTPDPNPSATATFAIVDRRASGYDVTRNGVVVERVTDPDAVLPAVEWAINQAAIDANADTYFLFHAGAVAHDGQGLLLPAASGSGKTTLATALLGAGFRYLSDDLAVVDPRTLRIHSFPKLPCLKRPADRRLLALNRGLPTMSAVRAPSGEVVAYLQVPCHEWAYAPVPVRWVVLPRFVPGAESAVTALPRSRALLRLMEQTFTWSARSPCGVARVVQMLRGAACFELIYGDVREAVHAVQEVVES